MTTVAHADPLHVLREYRNLAPWNLRDLSVVVGAVLDASAVTPINAAARAAPSERTIRFYVTRGLVSPPEGRGTAATYSYRHFLQLLAIKLRQMEGATLAAITKDMHDQTGDVLERRCAQVLGTSLPTPDRPTVWRRIPVTRGVELHVDADHPLARLGADDHGLAETVRQAIAKLLPHST